MREGKLEQGTAFEKGLTVRFVQESKSSDSYHYACALALNAQMKANAGLTREALKEIDLMSKVYSASEDSRPIHEANGLDTCALAYAKSALWYVKLDEQENGFKQCEFVIKMLGELRSTDTREMHAILTPIISIMMKDEKAMTSRMLSIYERYIVQKKEAEMPFFMRIMIIILTLSCDNSIEYKRIETFVDWLPTTEEIEVERDQPNYFCSSLGISLSTLAAMACLLIAHRLDGDRRSMAVDKGIALIALKSEEVNFNDIQVCAVAGIAYDHNQRVQSELQHLGHESGFVWHEGEEYLHVMRSRPTSKRSIRSTLFLRAKKVLPHELLISHDTIAFVGLTHDTLVKVFDNALAEEPHKCWDSISICYMADSKLQGFVSASSETDVEVEVETMRQSILDSRSALHSLLYDRVAELRFLEVNNHCFFGGWFGWRGEGGYIHVSPTCWGVNVKECPSQSYSWDPGRSPSQEYNSYRRGIDNLLEKGSTFATEVNDFHNGICELQKKAGTHTKRRSFTAISSSSSDNSVVMTRARLQKPRVRPFARSLIHFSRSSV